MEGSVKTRILAAATLATLGASSVAFAQTPVSASVAPDALHQVRLFEGSLRAAVESAGRQLADRARRIAPAIVLRLETEVRVAGSMLPEGEGAIFFVEVPGIEPDDTFLFNLYLRNLDPRRPVGNAPPTAGTVTSAVVPDEPVIPPMTDPDREYSQFTRMALVDAILDNAFALPLREAQSLTLVVSGVPTGVPQNPLAEAPRKLYLRIKAEDLIGLREKRITRDEARKRIREFRY
jgi:hypothetical protein